jgi:hypothetical protein
MRIVLCVGAMKDVKGLDPTEGRIVREATAVPGSPMAFPELFGIHVIPS